MVLIVFFLVICFDCICEKLSTNTENQKPRPHGHPFCFENTWKIHPYNVLFCKNRHAMNHGDHGDHGGHGDHGVLQEQ